MADQNFRSSNLLNFRHRKKVLPNLYFIRDSETEMRNDLYCSCSQEMSTYLPALFSTFSTATFKPILLQWGNELKKRSQIRSRFNDQFTSVFGRFDSVLGGGPQWHEEERFWLHHVACGDQGLNPSPRQWKNQVLTTGHPGDSPAASFQGWCG